MAIVGYTLPVFATAVSLAALKHLQNQTPNDTVEVDLINPCQLVNISIEQVAKISANQALAITRSEPGDNFDITQNTPIWALVKIEPNPVTEIIINGGEGIGRIVAQKGKPAIYNYAQNLLKQNILRSLKSPTKIEITIILPEGKKLAQKTSNSAFGIIEGLSLLGTSGISQPLTSKKQLEFYQEELKIKAKKFDNLVFCIGEKSLNLAKKIGLNSDKLVKTANWLGSMLATAGMLNLESITLVGYHGKLIKLAGGIFHTHHYLADARLEILTAHAANLGLPTKILQQLFSSPTTEAALNLLRELDRQNATNWVTGIYRSMAITIKQKCQDYIFKHSDSQVNINVILFDGDRRIIIDI
jgi:cobalt-precorrin-5B (C1)-methyltransferase